jgi:hypothetical protein
MEGRSRVGAPATCRAIDEHEVVAEVGLPLAQGRPLELPVEPLKDPRQYVCMESRSRVGTLAARRARGCRRCQVALGNLGRVR